MPFSLLCSLLFTAAPLIGSVGLDARDEARLRKIRALAEDADWLILPDQAQEFADDLATAGHRDPDAFGRAEALRALGHFGQNELVEARWHWQVALNFATESAVEEIFEFPDAAAFFGTIGLPARHPVDPDRDPDVKPAVPKKTVRPNRLAYLTRTRSAVAYGFQFTVGRDGVPHSPLVLGSVDGIADFVYSGLEGMRQWRYKPATLGGSPIEYPQTFNVNLGGSADRPPRAKRRRF